MKYTKIIVLAVVLMAGIFACKKSDDTNPASDGTVTVTIGQANIGETSITVPVVVSGNASIVQRGVCWDSIQTTPTISNHKKADSGTTSGSFSVLIDQLTPSTTYYVRGYVTTSSQTVYSPVRVYTTGSTQLTIDGFNNITDTSASINASLIYSGALQVGARGFCWGTQASPTIFSVNHDTIGSGAGLFSASIKGLQSNTKYYVRAYAIIGSNIIYSADSIFFTISPTCVDIDGNTYQSVKIGTQVWMKENLKTTKYKNGTLIPSGLSSAAWQATTFGACVDYNNAPANATIYGKLYNWYAVADVAGLCPVNWHVPSDSEWTTLSTYLGGDAIAGGAMKEAGFAHWGSANTGATNSSGFTALPGGLLNPDGVTFGGDGSWWSSTAYDASNVWYPYLISSLSNYGRSVDDKRVGHSVRCVKD